MKNLGTSLKIPLHKQAMEALRISVYLETPR
jgi:hypothetical protein